MSACSPVAPALWVCAATAALYLALPDCTHSRFFCQSCKSKACSMKSTEQWIAEQQHVLPDCEWQHITFTMPHLLWPFFSNNWPLLNNLFCCATRANWASRSASSAPCTPMCQYRSNSDPPCQMPK
nr:transposase zinc-binding domain-containing protein [Candidatus Erwinia dacicola]